MSSYSGEAHGGLNLHELRALGLDPARVIDFSVNSNPFGPPPSVLAAVRSVDLSVYPQRGSLALRERLAELNGTVPANVLVGNGSAELIGLAVQALLQPGERVVIVGPTFGEYRRAAGARGVRVMEVQAKAPHYRIDLKEVRHVAEKEKARAVFLCNPNNPTGQLLADSQITDLEDSLPPDCWLVLDEAYRAFVPGLDFVHAGGERTLLLRSMTKDFALAGLRLGYVLGQKDLIERMRSLQPTWSVNAPAQAAGQAALAELPYYKDSWRRLHTLAVDLFASLAEAGYEILPSALHYALLRAPVSGAQLRAKLLRRSLQVRDCASFGLPRYVRISTRLADQNRALLRALIDLHSEAAQTQDK
ncbi:MAG: adenosylcobyric acid synthase [Chloroflexota bacterium]|nr:adenosylcobyric acid synthase [Chloroflexota bacterium]